MLLRPVGTVRCPVKARKTMPPLGVPARLEIFPEYAPALLRLEKHSHIWVLAWLDSAERDVLQVTPRGVTDAGPEGLHGVFAVRSPVRPNPIGLTATRILRLEGATIEVERLDFLDGTPILDVKPYFVTRDAVFASNNAPIGRPKDRDALRQSLLLQAVNFHGELCPQLAVAVRLVEHFRTEVLGMAEAPVKARVPQARPCLIDAVMGMTRATLGRGTLLLHGRDAVRLDASEADVEYEPRWDTLPSGFDEILTAADERLFALR